MATVAASSSAPALVTVPLPVTTEEQKAQKKKDKEEKAKKREAKEKKTKEKRAQRKKLREERAKEEEMKAEATKSEETKAQEKKVKEQKAREEKEKKAAKQALKQTSHLAVVLEAARAVTAIFHARGLSCAVFGSLASKLYGCARIPKDVDMLVSQDPIADTDSGKGKETEKQTVFTAAELKDLILRSNSRNFYLKMPRDPAAEYRILWYRTEYLGPECKVDILVPGIMHLPHLNPARVRVIDGVPLVPFSLLLYHKLQGWDDHCHAEEAHKKRKQDQDAADVRRLMGLGTLVETLKGTRSLDDPELFNDEFQMLTRERVKRYCAAFGKRSQDWKLLGFDIICT